MKLFTCLLLILYATRAYSQQTAVLEGTVMDSLEKKPLDGATVELLQHKDSGRITATLSRKGAFRISKVPLRDSLVLRISFTGYEPFEGLLYIREGRFRMQPVYLQPASTSMEEVVLKARPALAVIKKDTVEFNASSFKTQPNAMAEDLVKRIPGLIIDEQGHLVYNGRPVSKILVDGKEFFGTDGRVALANIPVELIKKIQLANDSLQAMEREQQGEAVNNLPKTLNIKLKEGRKYFGNMQAGYGTDERYSLSGMINQQQGKERISLLGGWNNINRAGMLPPSGADITAFTSGGGITKSVQTGINYNRELKPNTDLTANYNFSRPVTFRESLRERKQNVFADSALLSNSSQQFENTSSNHGLNLGIRKKNGFNITAGINRNSYSNASTSGSTVSSSEGNLLNRSQQVSGSEGHNNGAQFHLGLNKRVNKKTYLGFNLGGNLNQQVSENRQVSDLSFYKNGVVDSSSVLRQLIEQDNRRSGLSAGMNFSCKVSSLFSFYIADNFSGGWSRSDKTTWKTDAAGQPLEVDTNFSNRFRSFHFSNNLQGSARYSAKKWQAQLGAGLQYNRLNNRDITHDSTSLTRQFNFVPSLSVDYGKDPVKAQYHFAIDMNSAAPTLSQLQPVADNSNPLYIRRGNPDLRPAINYGVSAGYNQLLSVKNGNSVSFSLRYNPVAHKIIRSVIYDSLGRQEEMFVNINGARSIGMEGSINFRMKSKAGVLMLGSRMALNQNRDIVLLNGVRSVNTITGFNPSLTLNYNSGNRFELSAAYTPSYNRLRYTQNPAQGNTSGYNG